MDDEACLKRIMTERYGGNEFDCPKCGVYSKFYRMTRERAYVCQHCKYQLHPTAETFMHRTHLPLHKWFYAMHMFANSRSASEGAPTIPYKTAWRMAADSQVHGEMASGPSAVAVAISKPMKRGQLAGSAVAAVFGMLERGDVVPDQEAGPSWPRTEPGSTVHTDELRSYFGGQAGYRHETVNHSAGEYVDGDCHVIVLGAACRWGRTFTFRRSTFRSM